MLKNLLLLMPTFIIVECDHSDSSNSSHDDFILNWTLLDAVYLLVCNPSSRDEKVMGSLALHQAGMLLRSYPFELE